jgi:hypothetical protein
MMELSVLDYTPNFPLAIIIIVSGSIWDSVFWRFRGGGFTALTGIDPGTGGMRSIAALGITCPLLALGGPWWALMVPALWIGWSLAGWGAFQGMGKSPVGTKNPLERVLSRFFAPLPMCLVGMAIEGAYTMILPGVVAGWCVDSWLVGLLVMPIYYYAQTRETTPDLGKFEHGGSELAECLVGAWLGLIMTPIPLTLKDLPPVQPASVHAAPHPVDYRPQPHVRFDLRRSSSVVDPAHGYRVG